MNVHRRRVVLSRGWACAAILAAGLLLSAVLGGIPSATAQPSPTPDEGSPEGPEELSGSTAPATPDRLAQPWPASEHADGTDLSLRLQSFSGVLSPGDDLRLRLQVRNASGATLEDLRVVVTLHARRGPGRFLYQRAVDQGDVGAILHAFTVDLPPIGPRGLTVTEVEQSAAQLGFARPTFGVYPLRAQLVREGALQDELVTSIVLAPEEVEHPLRVAIVVPFDAAPGRLADGSFRSERLAATLAPDGRLHELLAALEARPDLPVSVATSGLLLEQAAELSDGYVVADGNGHEREADPDTGLARQAELFLTRLAGVLARDEVEHLALPFGPGDLVALVRHGYGFEASRLVDEGVTTSAQLTGAQPTPGVLWPPDGLDRGTLVQLLGERARTLLLSEAHLDVPERGQYSPSPVRRMRTPAGTDMTVLVPDPWLEPRLEPTDAALAHGRAVAAQRVVAETAELHFETNATDRGLLLVPPQRWFPSPGFLGSLLDQLEAAPWVELVTLSELAEAVAPQPGRVALGDRAPTGGRELGGRYVEDLVRARRGLGSLALVLDDDAVPARFDRLLLQAASVHYRDQQFAPDGYGLIEHVLGTVSDLYTAVEVMNGPTVTLTSVEGMVPVSVRNGADVPLRVRVRLVTNRYEFGDEGTREVHLDAQSVKTITFGARALTPGGTTQIPVVVEDVAGTVEIASGTLVVRSTAYSGAALLVTGGAAVFLLAWWVRGATRRHRRRTVTEEPADEPSVVP